MYPKYNWFCLPGALLCCALCVIYPVPALAAPSCGGNKIPCTGDNSVPIWFFVAGMVVAAAVIFFLIKKGKQQK